MKDTVLLAEKHQPENSASILKCGDLCAYKPTTLEVKVGRSGVWDSPDYITCLRPAWTT